jgi:trehalose synthase
MVPEEMLESIRLLARELSGRSILHVYSGRLRSGLIEMLNRLGGSFEDLGLDYRATSVVGTEEILDVARWSDAPLPRGVSKERTGAYEEAVRESARKLFLSADLVVVHGLQPIGLVDHRRDGRPWLWRCHADLTGASSQFWAFVRRFLPRYQGVLFSHARFVKELEPPFFVVPPSIDPFAPVNRDASPAEVARVLDELRVPKARPLALQFLGSGTSDEALEAIRAWKGGRSPEDAVLVLLHVGATCELSSRSTLEALNSVDPRVRVLQLGRDSIRELCALGWAARVVVDASPGRWPNLDLLDVMWKGTAALVASTSATSAFIVPDAGHCVGSREELSRRLGEMLEDSDIAREMGAGARRSITRGHLMPRHLLDYLKLMLYFDLEEKP